MLTSVRPPFPSAGAADDGGPDRKHISRTPEHTPETLTRCLAVKTLEQYDASQALPLHTCLVPLQPAQPEHLCQSACRVAELQQHTCQHNACMDVRHHAILICGY